MTTPNNAVVVYVEDACGYKYCWSASRIEYRDSAVKHARWWTRQRRIGNAVRPLRVIVEEYRDDSQTA